MQKSIMNFEVYFKLFVLPLILSLYTAQSPAEPAVARDAFDIVDIKTVNADIFVEAAYSTDWNFIGKPIDGYLANKCYLTTKAAKALSEVQREVAKQGYSLLVFDCYRPLRAVNQFVTWTKDATDTKMQSIFYADEPKKNLIKNGYIASKSGHSRGSTVDLTLVRTDKFQSKNFAAKAKIISDCRKSQKNEDMGQVDMGTAYDCFSKLANTANPAVSESGQKNRQILKLAMEKQGFINYPKEWWHFSLNNEPYPKDYFDFEVQ